MGRAAQLKLVMRTGNQNYNFFGNGVSRVAIDVQRAIHPLNGLARAHVAGLMSMKSDRRGLISRMPTRAHAAAYNKGLVPPWRAASKLMLRRRVRRATIMVHRPTSATRHKPGRYPPGRPELQ